MGVGNEEGCGGITEGSKSWHLKYHPVRVLKRQIGHNSLEEVIFSELLTATIYGSVFLGSCGL